MAAPYPQFLPAAFAISAAGPDRNVIPAAPVTTQRASFSLGFPPLVMTPVAAGGKPMLGPDMNGVLYMLSTHNVYQQSGKLYQYSALVAAAISGYAIGTMLGSPDGTTVWYNTTAANSTDPDAGGAGWVAMFSYGITPITGLSSGVRTVTNLEAARNVIVLSGALVGNVQVILPTNMLRRWLIVNTCTGAFVTTVKTAAGSGVSVPQGGYAAPAEVWSDGANIYNVVAPVSLPIDQAATANTIVQRTSVADVFARYFNMQAALDNFPIDGFVATYNNDGYMRRISPLNVQAQLALSNFAGQIANGQVPLAAVAQHAAAIFTNAALTGTPTAPTAGVGDNSAQIASTAYVMSQSIGNTQVWTEETPNRAIGAQYTNNSGRTISVSAWGSRGGAPATEWHCLVNSFSVGSNGWPGAGGAYTQNLVWLVPPGATYEIQVLFGVTPTLGGWRELK